MKMSEEDTGWVLSLVGEVDEAVTMALENPHNEASKASILRIQTQFNRSMQSYVEDNVGGCMAKNEAEAKRFLRNETNDAIRKISNLVVQK